MIDFVEVNKPSFTVLTLLFIVCKHNIKWVIIMIYFRKDTFGMVSQVTTIDLLPLLFFVSHGLLPDEFELHLFPALLSFFENTAM